MLDFNDEHFDESRIDVIGQNGNDGIHYKQCEVDTVLHKLPAEHQMGQQGKEQTLQLNVGNENGIL